MESEPIRLQGTAASWIVIPGAFPLAKIRRCLLLLGRGFVSFHARLLSSPPPPNATLQKNYVCLEKCSVLVMNTFFEIIKAWCFSPSSPEKWNPGYRIHRDRGTYVHERERETEFDFRELTRAIKETGESTIYRVVQQVSGPCQRESWTSQTVCWQNCPCSEKVSCLFYLGLWLIGWRPLTLWRAICFSLS